MSITDEISKIIDQISGGKEVIERGQRPEIGDIYHLLDRAHIILNSAYKIIKEVEDREREKNLKVPELQEVGNRIEDISALPAQLRSQLRSVPFDETESLITKIMKRRFGGVASIDEILVGIFQETEKIEKREFIANKIYRMTRKKMLNAVPKRKGVYAVPDVDIDDLNEASVDDSKDEVVINYKKDLDDEVPF